MVTWYFWFWMLTTIEIPTDLKVHIIIGYMDKLWYHACSWVCRGAVFLLFYYVSDIPKFYSFFILVCQDEQQVHSWAEVCKLSQNSRPLSAHAVGFSSWCQSCPFVDKLAKAELRLAMISNMMPFGAIKSLKFFQTWALRMHSSHTNVCSVLRSRCLLNVYTS